MSDQPPGSHPHPERPGQQYPGQPYPGQPYPGQPYPGQPYPGQPYPGQPYPGQPYPGQPFPTVFQPLAAIPALPRTSYAHWGRRVLASVIDFAPSLVGAIVYFVGYVVLMTTAFADPSIFENGGSFLAFVSPTMIVGWLIMLAALPWNIYNRWIKGGKTGQSLGKRVVRLTLLSEQTGAPVGAGMAFLRDLVHTLDGMAYVGYLWPLWDEKRQTFADKLMQTVVLPAPDAAPRPYPPS